MRRFLVVIEDPNSEVDHPDALAEYLKALLENYPPGLRVLRVHWGGLLVRKVMDELPPVRHKDKGAYR